MLYIVLLQNTPHPVLPNRPAPSLSIAMGKLICLNNDGGSKLETLAQPTTNNRSQVWAAASMGTLQAFSPPPSLLLPQEAFFPQGELFFVVVVFFGIFPTPWEVSGLIGNLMGSSVAAESNQYTAKLLFHQSPYRHSDFMVTGQWQCCHCC